MKFEPIKPAPPVTRSFKTFSFFNLPLPEAALFAASMPRRRAASGDLVGAGLGNQIRCMQQRLESASIGPPAIQNAVRQRTLFEVHVVDIRDFQLVAPAGPGLADLCEDRGVVEIEAGNRVFGFGI